jgi:hypothetical protein
MKDKVAVAGKQAAALKPFVRIQTFKLLARTQTDNS